jgi:hypothetical protein
VRADEQAAKDFWKLQIKLTVEENYMTKQIFNTDETSLF